MSDLEQPSSTPPAGWYQDPQGVTRWWDGTVWGEAAPPPLPTSSPAAGIPPIVPPVAGSPAVLPAPGSAPTGIDGQTGTAALAHALGALGFLFPCFGWIGPLVIYLTAQPHQTFVRHHAAEELNFQLTT